MAKPLGALIGAGPKVLAVLDKHGVTFCAGCYLTLFSPPEKAAVYHAVPDVRRFMADLKRALKPKAKPRRRSGTHGR